MPDRRVVALAFCFCAATASAKTDHAAILRGGTADLRFIANVEAMLEAKQQELLRGVDLERRGAVTIFFRVNEAGRIPVAEIVVKSGDPALDTLAMRILEAAQPFPAPSPVFKSRGLYWHVDFDGSPSGRTNLRMK